MAVTKEYAWQEADSLPGGKGAGFKTVQDWLDFMDVTGYFGYYGLPQEPRWTDPEITAKKEQMEKEREAKKAEKEYFEKRDPEGEYLDEPVNPDFGDQEVHKHGGRIKKKKRKKKGRPRGVGKALRGYGKAMKHGK